MTRVLTVFIVTKDNKTTEVAALGCECFMNDF
jgi:hypothetical protein